MRHRIVLGRLIAVLLFAFSLPLAAQQFEQVGDYQIHYSAVNTSFLSEDIARAHDIPRNAAMALLNVSVLEERDDGTTRPVTAQVDGRVGGLDSEDGEPLTFRTLRDGEGVVSQIAVFRIHADAPMRFDLDVRYDRNAEPAEVSFIQRFYIER
ncbi:DUF4426 domain-containing protein [Billgrantia gudaonensis]|uniref:DUF4426 domain-containing protein n=1 Tax=Billgrantia gudaonensis TaxID=376427 RepID=A0A1G9CZZ8_9GAMM|nr:DUF4426 domain-containing protein [Halomonas gudaonensis]SDK57014.1 protein of unknown function [Halomonas gudaonensis]